MATIEGNEIALRNVFNELDPRSRDNTTAKNDNDTLPPFYTATYELAQVYGASLAPSWVYGLTYEGPGTATGTTYDPAANTSGPIYISWGTASGGAGSAEAVLYPGQTFEFPRAARRVFVRSAVAGPNNTVYVQLTWKLDLWARKTTSVGDTVDVSLWSGTGETATSPALPQSGVAREVNARSSLFVLCDNVSSTNLTYELLVEGTQFVIDTATINAGQRRVFHYGAGIGTNLPAGQQGHNFAFPARVRFQFIPAAPIVPGEFIDLSWWAR
jgi:hypothetical protein